MYGHWLLFPGYTGEYECTVNYPGKPGLILILEKKYLLSINIVCLNIGHFLEMETVLTRL